MQEIKANPCNTCFTSNRPTTESLFFINYVITKYGRLGFVISKTEFSIKRQKRAHKLLLIYRVFTSHTSALIIAFNNKI